MTRFSHVRISAVFRGFLIFSLLLLAENLLAQDIAFDEQVPEGPRCIVISDIAETFIESDRTIQISLRSNEKISIRLGEGCPQLKFHNFFTFQATGGQLCAEKSLVVSRSGETCPITSFDLPNIPTQKEDAGSAPE